ncbi:MAG: hypothetical protein PHH40_03480 [Candidatus Moranbacteria bacterium]|nr:hypothetical protein [Candidatus Moranbacteria bacterium]MDD3964691.1 hypothetical protein [Candidatus Moranbacteria bacterium]
MSETKSFLFASETAQQFAETALGGSKSERREDEEQEIPFAKRSPEEQTDLIYQIQTLVAKRRDLVRTMSVDSNEKPSAKQEEDTLDAELEALLNDDETSIKGEKIGGRYIPTQASIDREVEGVSEHSAVDAEKELAHVIEKLGELGKIPGIREAYGKEVTKLYFYGKLLRKRSRLLLSMSRIDFALADIRKKSKSSHAGVPVGKDASMLDRLEAKKKAIEKDLEIFQGEDDSVGPFLDRVATLGEYSDSFQKDRIVEFPSVKKVVNLGLEALRNRLPFTLAGHLGSGKTEVARHIAKLYMIENGMVNEGESFDNAYERLQPEFFSGSEESSVYDLIGKLKIKRGSEKEWSSKDTVELVQKYTEDMRVQGVMLDADKVLERVLSSVVQGGDVETVFNYGPLGRALRDGRPIIIDEINMIPPQVLGRINDIAIKSVGKPIILQENGDETFHIDPGFAVLSTFNVGRQYHGTQEWNVAQASRWSGPKVDYPTMEETYDLVLTALLRKDRLRFPPNFPAEEFPKLAKLAVAVREIQELFSGQTKGQRFMALKQGMRAEKSQLEKTVISTRDLMRKIILPWRESNFTKSLDEIIADNILATAGTHSEDDQKFLTELLIRTVGLFEGWTAEDFKKHHIESVSDDELQTLHGAINTPEYKESDPHQKIFEKLDERIDKMKSTLLLGTK